MTFELTKTEIRKVCKHANATQLTPATCELFNKILDGYMAPKTPLDIVSDNDARIIREATGKTVETIYYFATSNMMRYEALADLADLRGGTARLARRTADRLSCRYIGGTRRHRVRRPT